MKVFVLLTGIMLLETGGFQMMDLEKAYIGERNCKTAAELYVLKHKEDNEFVVQEHSKWTRSSLYFARTEEAWTKDMVAAECVELRIR